MVYHTQGIYVVILLLGGTSDTAPLVSLLIDSNFNVLVSMATDNALDIPSNPKIERRAGPLDEDELASLIREKKIHALIDATHPYASEIRRLAPRVAERCGVSYLTFVRPSALDENHCEAHVHFVDDHEHAAHLARSFARPILLTTGSRNLTPYIDAVKNTDLPLYARVLPHQDSITACLKAGIAEQAILPGRGPFSIEENRAVIQQYAIGTVITKDGGKASGIQDKLAATQNEDCQLIVIRRPMVHSTPCFQNYAELVEALRKTLRDIHILRCWS